MPKTILCCGDREWTSREVIYTALASLPTDTIIVHGAARGADSLSAAVAMELGLEIHRPPTKEHPLGGYPADWKRLKRAAGPIRNREMLMREHPDEVWAFHNHLNTRSRGTRDMVNQAISTGIPVCHFTEYESHYLNKQSHWT